MTNTNKSDASNIAEKNDELYNETFTGNAPTVLNTLIEQTAIPKAEEQRISIEKPKRPGRKKRGLSSTLNMKAENLNTSDVVDTQPLFEQPVILEGKRSRKPTSRLELSDLVAPRKELSIPRVNFIRTISVSK